MSTDIKAVPVTEDTTRTRAPLVRTFTADITAGDGRTIDLRIVPFGERATVADGMGGVPVGVPYEEEWMPGVFDNQIRAANRVLLNYEHQKGIGGIVGHGSELRRASDGYHGSFRVHDTADGEKALYLAREGVLTGASLEAYPRKSVRTKTGIVQRILAHLDAVAICRVGAFVSAGITAIRTDEFITETVVDDALLPLTPDPLLVERLRAQGVRLPDRYTKAHPAGHPDTIGTPEDGTRHTDNTTSSEE